MGAYSKLGALFGSPYTRDHSVLGSISRRELVGTVLCGISREAREKVVLVVEGRVLGISCSRVGEGLAAWWKASELVQGPYGRCACVDDTTCQDLAPHTLYFGIHPAMLTVRNPT